MQFLKALHQLIDLYRDVDLTEECRMTLGEWLDKWLDEYMLFTIRESTLQSYRMMAKNQVKRFIGDKKLAYLTTADVQKFYNKIKKEGRATPHPVYGYELSDNMVRGVHMMLHQALDVAVKERLLARNPTVGTTIPRVPHVEKQILDDSQLDTFLNTIKAEPYWYDFFYVEIMTGLRRGEILGLKWSDINFKDGSPRIARQVVATNKKIEIQPPKTRTSIRTILLPPYMVEILAKMHEQKTCEWVFPSPVKEGEPRNPTALHHRFKLILQRAGCKDIRFHDLRHTFATLALENGMDVKTLSGIIGHTDASFTVNTKYGHTKEKNKIREIKVALIQCTKGKDGKAKSASPSFVCCFFYLRRIIFGLQNSRDFTPCRRLEYYFTFERYMRKHRLR